MTIIRQRRAETDQVRSIQFIQEADQDPLPAPLVRVSTCGLLTVEILEEILSTEPPTARYVSLTPEQLRGRGTAPALLLLKLLVNSPHRFASRDWLLSQFCRDDEVFSSVRIDNIVSILRGLLCPPAYEGLRTQLVGYVRSRSASGDGYQLAAYPLVWVDHEALSWHAEQAVRMQRFGEDGLPFWERAYALAKRGTYLPDEMYSDWATARRGEVQGMLRQSVQVLGRMYVERYGAAGEEEALLLLRSYWHEHPQEEDVLRPLMELLGRRECYHEALEYYERLCKILEAEECQPDAQTQDVAAFLRAKQLQRPARQQTVQMVATNPSFVQQTEGVHSSEELHPQGLPFSSDVHYRRMQEAFQTLEGIAHVDLSEQLTRRDFLIQLLSIPSTLAALDGRISTNGTSTIRSRTERSLTLYEELLTIAWEHYYTNNAHYIAQYADRWIEDLTEILALTRGQEQTSFLKLLCRFYQLSGVVARDRMDLPRAFSDGKKAVELAFQVEDSELIAAALFRYAKTFLKQERYQSAVEHLHAACAYAKRARDPLKGYVYQATAEAYALLGAQDDHIQTQSLLLFDRAEQTLMNGHLVDDGSFVKFNLAGLSLDRASMLTQFQQPQAARQMLEVARQHLNHELTRWQIRLLLAEAQTDFAEEELEACYTHALEAAHLARTTGSQSNQRRVLALQQQWAMRLPHHPLMRDLREQLE